MSDNKQALSKERIERTHNILDTVYKFLKIAADDPNLPYFMEQIEKLDVLADELMKNDIIKFHYDGQLNGHMQKGAYWDEAMFGKLDKESSVPGEFNAYDIEVTSHHTGSIKIWAHSQDEAVDIGGGLTDIEIAAFVGCSSAGILSKVKDLGFILSMPFGDIWVSNEDIDDIMESAMSGCTYWCGAAKPIGAYYGNFASEQISRGGRLKFYPIEDDPVELDRDNFCMGLTRWLREKWEGHEDIDYLIHTMENDGTISDRINPGEIDADAADVIIQYALFGELVYS